MRAPRHTYETTLAWGGDIQTGEADVKVSFGVTSDGEIEDITLEMVDGKPRPWGMYSGYVANEDDEFEQDVLMRLDTDDHAERMLQVAAEDHACHLDQLRERDQERRWEAGQ